MTHEQEQAIGRDLELCDLIDAVGNKAAKRKAKAHRAKCIAAIRESNKDDETSLDELYAELTDFA